MDMCYIYILQANLIGGPGGDEDHLPPDGGNPHPMPNLPFGGIWEDAAFQDIVAPIVVAPHAQNAAPAADDVPIIQTPPRAHQCTTTMHMNCSLLLKQQILFLLCIC
jgi:hypothetical protein